MSNYIPIIGLEIHIELKTKSKMFCQCASKAFDVEPNVNICPVCTGQPGALPVANVEGLKQAYKMALAMNCKIPNESRFERKNYFYPDLPKGYQISSPHFPQGIGGYLEFEEKNGEHCKVHLDHIHLEEDAGKLIHDETGGQYALVDFNRAGVPLLEVVSDALTEDINSAEIAVGYAKAVRNLARAIGISEVNMHKGEMRFDLNISLKKKDQEGLGNRVEVKNLNSFKALESAIQSEIKRQTELLDKGERIKQQTVGFNYQTGETVPQRTKEEAADYRYFPEPDIPRIDLTQSDSPIKIDLLEKELPETPYETYKRFVKDFGMAKDNARIITNEKEIASFFENVCTEIKTNPHDKKANRELKSEEIKKAYKLASNYVVTELNHPLAPSSARRGNSEVGNCGDNSSPSLIRRESEGGLDKLTAENFAELMKYLVTGQINSSVGQELLKAMLKTGIDPSHYLDEKNLWQQSNEGELGEVIKKVIESNPNAVADYTKGKETAVKFLVGQVMRETKGKADPKVAEKLLVESLKSKV